jgi:hypothetical protein
VSDILFIQGKLDDEYLRRWASDLGDSTALEEALRTANDTH